jgi:hypothetical protein
MYGYINGGKQMKVKDVIKVLQDNYDLEEEIWYDVYSENDLDLIDVQATPKEWLAIIATMHKYQNNDAFVEAVDHVLGNQEVNR